MMFSSLIIAVAFLPLFTMTGVSGVIFSPMAITYAFAIGGAILLALTLTPVLSSLALHADIEEKESFVMRMLERIYQPLFRVVLARPRTAVALSLLPIVICGLCLRFLGGEFMPKLEEGIPVDPRHAPHLDLAGALGELRRPDAGHPPRLPQGHQGDLHRAEPEAPRSGDGGLPARPARRRHPTSRASTTSSSSRP